MHATKPCFDGLNRDYDFCIALFLCFQGQRLVFICPLCSTGLYSTVRSILGQNIYITKTRLFKYIDNFTIKNWKFSDKKTVNFFSNFKISAQNIDCGYSLEPPRRGGSNEYPQFMFWAEIRKLMYTPVNPSVLYKNYIGMFSWWW